MLVEPAKDFSPGWLAVRLERLRRRIVRLALVLADAEMEMALVAPMDGEKAVARLDFLGLAGRLELIGGAGEQWPQQSLS